MIPFRLVSFILPLQVAVQGRDPSLVQRLQELNIRTGLVSNTDARMRA